VADGADAPLRQPRWWRKPVVCGNIVVEAHDAVASDVGADVGDESGQARGPLSGVRVIDLSAVVSGPFATSILADQGADVITVEQARRPDIVRFSGPLAASADGVSAYWAAMNRNKRAVALDLKHPQGKQIFKGLVETADVVVQNFRPGALERLELGWDVLSAVNPRLIMCSISAYGPDGPYAQRPAYDPILQAIAGYASVQAGDGEPKLVRTIVCDKVTALNVAQSICAALVARANGAGGQHIDVAMLDVAVHFLWPDAMWNNTYLDHPSEMPDLASIYNLQRTNDGWVIAYGVANDGHWKAMCEAFERPELVTDPRFVDVQARIRNGQQANDAVEAETMRFTTAEVVELLARAGVPVAPVHDRTSMIADPQVQHRQLIVETTHPSAGRIRQSRPPVRFSKTPTGLHRHAPRFGEHTDEVLADTLALDTDAIRQLREAGAIH
jgi:crotonobetainyl-CoA:carnitine CoA-transferase CaiB-like acyl-CoA transferase